MSEDDEQAATRSDLKHLLRLVLWLMVVTFALAMADCVGHNDTHKRLNALERRGK